MKKYSTHILDKVLERKKDEREQRRIRFLEKVFSVLDTLSRDVEFDEAYLFGSVTKPWQFFKESDLDVGFRGLKDEDYFKVKSFMSNALGIDVDVIQMEDHKLAACIEEGIQWKRKE